MAASSRPHGLIGLAGGAVDVKDIVNDLPFLRSLVEPTELVCESCEAIVKVPKAIATAVYVSTDAARDVHATIRHEDAAGGCYGLLQLPDS